MLPVVQTSTSIDCFFAALTQHQPSGALVHSSAQICPIPAGTRSSQSFTALVPFKQITITSSKHKVPSNQGNSSCFITLQHVSTCPRFSTLVSHSTYIPLTCLRPFSPQRFRSLTGELPTCVLLATAPLLPGLWRLVLHTDTHNPCPEALFSKAFC